jgi:hypothetical protein
LFQGQRQNAVATGIFDPDCYGVDFVLRPIPIAFPRKDSPKAPKLNPFTLSRVSLSNL